MSGGGEGGENAQVPSFLREQAKSNADSLWALAAEVNAKNRMVL